VSAATSYDLTGRGEYFDRAEALLPDGVFVLGEGETLELAELLPPEDEEVLRLVQRLGGG
jgi:hypothetical protein